MNPRRGRSDQSVTVNPALSELEPLVGRWRMELHGAAFLPGPDARLTGAVEIDWIEGGAALRMRQGGPGLPPAATWIIGRDELEPGYSVLYADARGVSRVYAMTLTCGHWRMWRDAAGFSQRFEALLDADADAVAIRGHWEKSTDARVSWQHDFNVDYYREPRAAPG
jgi:hypothetical protein